jgi:hypothetical protein
MWYYMFNVHVMISPTTHETSETYAKHEYKAKRAPVLSITLNKDY